MSALGSVKRIVPRASARLSLYVFICLLGALLSGCWAAPSPLTPQFEGSIGVPHHGVLTGGVELPKAGPGYRRYRQFGAYNFARPRLVRAVQEVAAEVARKHPGGPPLIVGDLSARTGGKIQRHNSHRTGRDVDLLWYVSSPRGAPVQNPGFIRIGTDGLASTNEGYLRLDVERQWTLVKALLQNQHIDVQWMFCSRDIEAQLIDYALARGEDLELVWHAETVLLQPGDSLPHDDHIHLRVACTREEMLHGCQGGGPHWEWLGPLPALEASNAELMLELAQEAPPTTEPEPERAAADSALPVENAL